MAQLDRYRVRDLPELDFVTDWLERNRPAMSAAAIMHGDYSPFNVMVAPDPPARLAAVIDWDTGTIGDPLLDIGHLLARWTNPGEEPVLQVAGRRDRALPDASRDWRPATPNAPAATCPRCAYYECLALFKLAVILEGTYARKHQDGVPDSEIMMVELVPRLTRAAAAFAPGRARVSGPDPREFDGRVVVVTGGSRGIGRAVADRLRRRGRQRGHRQPQARQLPGALAAELDADYGVSCLPVAYHAAQWDDSDRLADEVLERYGRCDVLVNNAGMSPLTTASPRSPRSTSTRSRRSISRGRSGCRRGSARRWPGPVAARSSTSARSARCARAAHEIVYACAKAGLNALDDRAGRRVRRRPSG